MARRAGLARHQDPAGQGDTELSDADDGQEELRVYLLAYNLVRGLMLRAAIRASVLPRQLSFKHTVQLWLLRNPSRNEADLLTLVAQRGVGRRPGESNHVPWNEDPNPTDY